MKRMKEYSNYKIKTISGKDDFLMFSLKITTVYYCLFCTYTEFFTTI